MSPTLAVGIDSSQSEVTNISFHGFWLYTHGSEYFLSFEDFPWFKEKSVKQIFHFEELSPEHFYWPELDIDLSIEMIKNPQRFPLKAKN
jgi:hypothetical protein